MTLDNLVLLIFLPSQRAKTQTKFLSSVQLYLHIFRLLKLKLVLKGLDFYHMQRFPYI